MRRLKGLKYGIGALVLLGGIVLCWFLFLEGIMRFIIFVRDKLYSRPLGEYDEYDRMRKEKFERKVTALLIISTCGSFMVYIFYQFTTIFYGSWLDGSWLDALLFDVL